jgi:general stress protein YciG
MTPKDTKPRGFATISPERHREIASQGGKAAHTKGTAHKFTSAEAQAAGKKGGAKVSANRKHMAEIGRLGGLKRDRHRTEAVETHDSQPGTDESGPVDE